MALTFAGLPLQSGAPYHRDYPAFDLVEPQAEGFMRRYTSATSFPDRRGFSYFPSLIRSVRPASEPGLLQNRVVHNLHIA